jgi:hypothetical protein
MEQELGHHIRSRSLEQEHHIRNHRQELHRIRHRIRRRNFQAWQEDLSSVRRGNRNAHELGRRPKSTSYGKQ